MYYVLSYNWLVKKYELKTILRFHHYSYYRHSHYTCTGSNRSMQCMVSSAGHKIIIIIIVMKTAAINYYAIIKGWQQALQLLHCKRYAYTILFIMNLWQWNQLQETVEKNHVIEIFNNLSKYYRLPCIIIGVRSAVMQYLY